MILIVGLGNPGEKYENTRHNVGFKAVDFIATNFRIPKFVLQAKPNAQISKGEIVNQKVVLAKPQAFMNLSGKAVKNLLKFYKIASPHTLSKMVGASPSLVVIHDDIDLPVGKMKISIGRGSAGHRGVQSVIDELKTKEFVRFRIGICPQTGKPKNPEEFVLQKFTKDEEEIIKNVIEKNCEAVEFFIKEGVEKTLSKYNA